MTDFSTSATNTWCPGCGNFSLLRGVKEAFKKYVENGGKKKDLVISTGIGCHGKIFDYLDVSGFYSLHGREVATATGIKLANPDLDVVAFAGDGDIYNEGVSHLVHAAKRNIDITLVVHDNQVFALTTGQFTATSPKGFKGKTTPEGSVEEPLNPLKLMIASNGSFVARGFCGKREHLRDLILKGIDHCGFAFIDVLQPSVAFNNTWDYFNERVVELGEMGHDLGDKEEAMERASFSEKEVPIGVFYKEKRASFDEKVLGENKPVDDVEKDVEGVLNKLK